MYSRCFVLIRSQECIHSNPLGHRVAWHLKSFVYSMGLLAYITQVVWVFAKQMMLTLYTRYNENHMERKIRLRLWPTVTILKKPRIVILNPLKMFTIVLIHSGWSFSMYRPTQCATAPTQTNCRHWLAPRFIHSFLLVMFTYAIPLKA